ncbi:hypothetical protein [Methylomagnum ishizawai]|uniref:hypothetical protein n=1 Tax=Methylomagnum ishizawai TaxID=1760988 RepID=UPI001C342784|nr:hypothetical protein [Methylomagnum ishizawai]BBL73685.1 hypothetical protein MishRS11D_07830 [Methylomagnum ishizawai]
MGKASRRKKDRHQESSKLSNAISIMIEPLLSKNPTEDEYRKVIPLAAVGWNVAVFPVEERPAKLIEFLKSGDSSVLEEFELELKAAQSGVVNRERPSHLIGMLEVVKYFIERKDELYPNDKHFIVDFDLVPEGQGFRITISSVHSDGKVDKSLH